jgi:hypothetical protein
MIEELKTSHVSSLSIPIHIVEGILARGRG